MFRKWNYEKKQKLVGFSFILPWLIGFCAFTAFPLGYCFYMALNKVNFVTDHLEMQWLGFENFRKVLYEDAEIPNKLMQTFQQSLLIVPLIVVFALIMALMLNSKFPGRAFYRAVFFLPVMLTSGNLISTLTSQGQGSISFLQSGTAAQLVAGIGGTLGETLQTVLDNFLVILWYSGVQMLLLIAGMQSINPSTYEAAKIDGASPLQTFFKITVPLLKPMILLTTITSTNGTLQLFDESLNLTNGGPGKSTMTMSHYIYNMSFVQSPNFGYAAAMSILILIMVAILALIQMKVGDER